MRRAWRPLADAQGDSPFGHSEARRAEESRAGTGACPYRGCRTGETR